MEIVIKLINLAETPEDLFGKDPGSVKGNYKKLASKVHPDKNFDKTSYEMELLKKCFQKIQKFKELADERIRLGIYGTLEAVKEKFQKTVINSKRNSYTLYDQIEDSDLCNVFKAFDKDDIPVIMKIAMNPSYNPLLENEIKKIKQLHKTKDINFHHFFPEIIESYLLKDDKGRKLQVIIMPDYTAEGYVDLKEVKDAYEHNELNPRHLVWIGKRLFESVGYINNNGITHTSILPHHVLIHPVNHNIIILGWSSATNGNKPRLINKKWKFLYPHEVLNKKFIGGYTDVFMIARTLYWLFDTHNNIPDILNRFLISYLISNTSMRGNDAWIAREELNKAAEKLYGKPKYVRLDI